MKVPFLDLKAQYESIRGEIADAIQQVLDRTAFAGGPFVAQFEKEFAAFCGTQFAVGVGSGTDALWLALLGLGIGPGDEVITVPDTFIATAEAISWCGAKPVFVDVDPVTYNMDPSKLEAAITEKTKAIIPVHLFGQMADMDPILEIARKRKLFVDRGRLPGARGGVQGEEGRLDRRRGLLQLLPGKEPRRLRRGRGRRDEQRGTGQEDPDAARPRAGEEILPLPGRVERPDGRDPGSGPEREAQAPPRLERGEAPERRPVRRTPEGRERGRRPRKRPAYAKHVYHIYAIRVADRDRLIASLAEKDIHCGIHYPIPVHLLDAYKSLNLGKGSFPVAEKSAAEFVSLPMFPELTREQVRAVAEGVKVNSKGMLTRS